MISANIVSSQEPLIEDTSQCTQYKNIATLPQGKKKPKLSFQPSSIKSRIRSQYQVLAEQDEEAEDSWQKNANLKYRAHLAQDQLGHSFFKSELVLGQVK